MHRHVEVVRFEAVSHLSEALQGVLSHSLFKTECFTWFAALLIKAKERSSDLNYIWNPIFPPACSFWAPTIYPKSVPLISPSFSLSLDLRDQISPDVLLQVAL